MQWKLVLPLVLVLVVEFGIGVRHGYGVWEFSMDQLYIVPMTEGDSRLEGRKKAFRRSFLLY